MATIHIGKLLTADTQAKICQRVLLANRATEIKTLAITAALRYGGGCGYINSSAINRQCAFRQVGASNPPQHKAAKRYRSE